jgi:quinol monooxygenase YgiN
MIVVLASITARPAERESALVLAREHVERSRREPGCISHEVLGDPDNDDRGLGA